MRPNASLKIAAGTYDLLWRLAIPLLSRQRRLAQGAAGRMGNHPLQPADLWIQAASAGEAYLAAELLKSIAADNRTRLLLTSGTSQGIEILQNARRRAAAADDRSRIQVAYFPFDRPTIMRRVVAAVDPRVMVLLETEIWPGLLLALKAGGGRILVINGRLSPKSLRRYILWPSLWHRIGPDAVLAITPADAGRFRRLFDGATVGTMPNMKFDRIDPDADGGGNSERIGTLIPREAGLVVLGSIRRQEEPDAERIISGLLNRHPNTVVGLFPRHMHRIASWQKRLAHLPHPWQLRSRLTTAAHPGSIILWDTFGDLSAAYGHARAAFVGGSLKPLGGQNFLEPLLGGAAAVIGPHWRNFAWIGPEIVQGGLVQVASDWQGVVGALTERLADKRPRTEVRAAALAYIQARRGGTRRACELITDHLERSRRRQRLP